MAVDYDTLTGEKSLAGSIKSLVNYTKLDPAIILTEAQAYIFGGLRTREMRATATVSIAEGASTAPLPTGFLEPLKLQGPYGPIEPKDETEFLEIRFTDPTTGELEAGPVSCYSIFNETLNFDVKAEAATTATFLFHQRPADLAGTGTNFLTSRYPNMLLAACRFYAYLAMENGSEAANWKKIADDLIARANVETDLARRGIDYGTRSR